MGSSAFDEIKGISWSMPASTLRTFKSTAEIIKEIGAVSVDYVVFPHGEDSKNINTYAFLCEELLKRDIRRGNLLIASSISF